MESKESNSLDKYIESGQFYKSVVEDGSDTIFIVDYKGVIKYHNPSVEETLGHAPKSLQEKNFFDYIHPDSLAEFKVEFNDSTKKPFDSSVEFMFLCANNEYKNLEFNSINLKPKNNVNTKSYAKENLDKKDFFSTFYF